MKKKSLIYFVFLLFGIFYGCKKETASKQSETTSASISLEKLWWHAYDWSEHCFFDANGRYYYIKTQPNSFDIHDTANSKWKGNWNWVHGDTLIINYGGVQQGTCVVKKLNQDTMIMDVNVKGNFPLRGYSWVNH